MGCAPIAHLLYTGESCMRYSPRNPKWINRDRLHFYEDTHAIANNIISKFTRLVLSNGHACALLYSMCHLTGYAISMTDLQQFRQLGSITPGHPENFLTPGVEVSTGPLGQGEMHGKFIKFRFVYE